VFGHNQFVTFKLFSKWFLCIVSLLGIAVEYTVDIELVACRECCFHNVVKCKVMKGPQLVT